MGFLLLLLSARLCADPLALQFTRSFSLYRYTKESRVVCEHVGKVKRFVPLQFRPIPSFSLWKPEISTRGPTPLTDELFDAMHPGPGTILLKDPNDSHLYELRSFDTTLAPGDLNPGKKTIIAQGRIGMFFNLDMPQDVVAQKLQILYHWMASKHDIVAEICVFRPRKCRPPKSEFLKMLEDCVHYRPEIILKAMPLGTGIIIDPHVNREQCCWTMGGPVGEKDGVPVKPTNITKRLATKRRMLFELGAADLNTEVPMLTDIELSPEGELIPSKALDAWLKYRKLRDKRRREQESMPPVAKLDEIQSLNHLRRAESFGKEAPKPFKRIRYSTDYLSKVKS